MITAFLVVLSAGILTLVIQESKNTRLVSNSISTYAWSEWMVEYALLKIKNHSEWFADKIDFNNDYDANILAVNQDKPVNKDIKSSYEINNNAKIYSWAIISWEFEIIPLYYDNWVIIDGNAKNPNIWSSNIIKTSSFKLTWDSDFVWNIIWNDSSWKTFWMVGTWSNIISIWAWYSVISDEWKMKTIEENSALPDSTKIIKLNIKKISDFLSEYGDNYLIVYNNSNKNLNYNIVSNEWFSLPKLEIIASAKIGNYKKNILFSENKSKYMDMLKYSVFNK